MLALSFLFGLGLFYYVFPLLVWIGYCFFVGFFVLCCVRFWIVVLTGVGFILRFGISFFGLYHGFFIGLGLLLVRSNFYGIGSLWLG